MTAATYACDGLVRHYPIAHGPWWRRRSDVRRALDGVDLVLGPNRHTAIVGGSGSGKSTLLRLLLGLEAADAGSVTFAGRPVHPDRPGALRWLRRDVQFVAQDPGGSLDPRCTVGESIREPLECLGIDGDHRARAAELLAAVGLDPAVADRRPGTLSGGERQRIALARALAPRPSVLLADEPFSAVDAATRVALVGLIRSLAAADGLQLVLVSHDLGVVDRLCDDVVVLDAGRVVEAGPVAEVLSAPRTPATRRLLAAVPRLPAPASGAA